MWECPCADYVCPVSLVQGLFLVWMPATSFFRVCWPLPPWIGGVIGIVVSRACAGCEAGPPLCSVAINELLEAGSSSQLLE